MYEKGGPWLPEHHQGRRHWEDESGEYDEPMIARVGEIVKPKLVLDWGCGLGWYLGYFRRRGAWTVGIEPYDMGDDFEGHHQIQHDMTEPKVILGTFDLVICTEVMEHIPREGHDVAFDNLCASVSDWLLFSAAVVGQEGEGHVACRPETEWKEELQSRGLKLNFGGTFRVRRAAALPWFQKNAMLWRVEA